MLASMSQTEWSDPGVSELPTGTVTLRLADVEGSTRLWKTQPDAMTAAIALLDDTLRDLIELRGRSAACTLENGFRLNRNVVGGLKVATPVSKTTPRPEDSP